MKNARNRCVNDECKKKKNRNFKLDVAHTRLIFAANPSPPIVSSPDFTSQVNSVVPFVAVHHHRVFRIMVESQLPATGNLTI